MAGQGAHCERIDLVRRRTERWTDVLVARLLALAEVAEFAVDPQRCRLFADDFENDARRGQADQAWQIMAASLRAGMRRISLPTTPNGDLNARIAAGIVSCFEPELFSDSGCLHALWHARLTAGMLDVQGMVEELLGSPPAPLRQSAARRAPAPPDRVPPRRPPENGGSHSSNRF
jgi:hypothetical protein